MSRYEIPDCPAFALSASWRGGAWVPAEALLHVQSSPEPALPAMRVRLWLSGSRIHRLVYDLLLGLVPGLTVPKLPTGSVT